MIEKPEFTGVNEDFEIIFNAAGTENMNRAKVSLWIMEQMIHQNLITIEQAGEAYQRMKECKRRLPWALAEEKLKVLEKEEK